MYPDTRLKALRRARRAKKTLLVRFKADLSQILMTFLLALVGIALTPTIADQANQASGNLTGAAKAMMALVPLFWVLIIIGIAAAAVYAQFKGLK